MAWIEVHQSVWTHRKTFELAGALNVEDTYAAGHLIRLWCWALDNAPDGDLSKLSDRAIAFGAGWREDSALFVRSLTEAGWIDNDRAIHDWSDYVGRLIEQRRHQASQKVRARSLYNTPALTLAVQSRDQNRCRYCSRAVNWKDRRGPLGGTYDHVDPSGENTLENLVVACRACNAGKGDRTPDEAGYRLLPVPAGLPAGTSTGSPDDRSTGPSGRSPVDQSRKNLATGPNRTGPNSTGPSSSYPPSPPSQAKGGTDPSANGRVRSERRRKRGELPSDAAEYLSGPYGAVVAERMAEKLTSEEDA